MDSMLALTVIIISGIEAIFSAKCCAISDANLKIILTNTGELPITVSGRFSLLGVESTVLLNLYPQGFRTISPGEGAAFYGTMDTDRWTGFQKMTVADMAGQIYKFNLHHKTD